MQSLQLEQGSKATSYEAYIEPQIFVRNSNGVYEEFTKKSEEVYSTEEQVIGTWIDGKPLYRKTIVANFELLKQETNKNYDKTIAHNISNFSKCIKASIGRTKWNTVLSIFDKRRWNNRYNKCG